MSLTTLPCELVASILASLDDFESLTAALLTCRHVYNSFKQIHGINVAILRQQVTPALLPYAVAVIEASLFRLHHPREIESEAVRDLVDTLYDNPSILGSRIQAMPVSHRQEMSKRHQAIVELASRFAAESWGRLHSDQLQVTMQPNLSVEERHNFCRAFYRLELFYTLFRNMYKDRREPLGSTAHVKFFSRNSPWENEQIGCVAEFWESKFAEASTDVIAHDVLFGELNVDYLHSGRRNDERQLWVRALFDVLRAYCNDDSESEGRDEGDLLSIVFSRGMYEDVDKGPCEAWYAAHKSQPVGSWLMLDHNDWLRDRAYVLWDWQRIQQHQLLKLFESVPDAQMHRPEPTTNDLETMSASFVVRETIFENGGLGYWTGNGHEVL
ncbi:amp dependent ligase [Colletotrichum camelliae]|nr:amp dependent ligase [Colletotrichum camelliae]